VVSCAGIVLGYLQDNAHSPNSARFHQEGPGKQMQASDACTRPAAHRGADGAAATPPDGDDSAGISGARHAPTRKITCFFKTRPRISDGRVFFVLPVSPRLSLFAARTPADVSSSNNVEPESLDPAVIGPRRYAHRVRMSRA